jgi:hypothetical protein
MDYQQTTALHSRRSAEVPDMKLSPKNITATLVLAAVLCAGLRAVAVRVGDNKVFGKQTKSVVTRLDAISFNGATLSLVYTLQSPCPASEHTTELAMDTERQGKKVVAFRLKITDSAPAQGCRGAAGPVTVSHTADFRALYDATASEALRAGFTVDPNAFLYMPEVNPLASDGAAVDIGAGTIAPPATGAAPPPAQVAPPVSITLVEYEPVYECTTWKRDGARKDGFTGTGSSLEEARKGAANGCARTNHPMCVAFSQNPEHTDCTVSFQKAEKLVQLGADAQGQGAAVTGWSCALGNYQGSGATMDQASRQTLDRCRAANAMNCDAWVRSGSMSCAPSLRYAMPQPQAQWACMLWKNDGARKDGFRGTGNTEIEARRAASRGCKTTNNPSCDTWSLDPAHTRCDVEFSTPGAN